MERKNSFLTFAIIGILAVAPLCAQNYTALVDSASHYMEVDSLAEAADCLKRAIACDSGNKNNVLLLTNLGSIQCRQGLLKEAVESYSLALNYRPLAMPILLARAAVYLELDNEEKAYVDYCNVLDQDIDNQEALLFRAYIAVHQHAYDIARADYTRLLRLDPQNENGRLGLALLSQKQLRLKEATEQLSSLVLDYPENPTYYIARADVLSDRGLFDLALLDFESALKIDASDPYTYVSRAEMYLKMKKKRQAHKDLDQAVALGLPQGTLSDLYKRCQ